MNRFDLGILDFINQLAHRSLFFDELIVLVSGNNFIKGALVIAAVWYLWFQNQDARDGREYLLAGVGAGFIGLVVAKVLTWTFFRPRPLNVPGLLHHPPYGIDLAGWGGLSSFPSDHAVLFFALATGIFFASRRIGWMMFLYVSVFICLPRMYLGIHYPTDVLVGAVIGVSTAWIFHLPSIRKPLTNWAFTWLDAKPGQFYAFSFLLTYIICELFDPLISIANFLRHGHLSQ